MGVSQDNDGLRHAPVKEPLGYKFCMVSQKSVLCRPCMANSSSHLMVPKTCSHAHICASIWAKIGLYTTPYMSGLLLYICLPLKMGRMSATRCWV